MYEMHIELQHKKSILELPWCARAKGAYIVQDIQIRNVIKCITNIKI